MSIGQKARRASAMLGFLAAFATWMTPASAQDFPTRPITVWAAFPPGAAGDLYLRQLADIVSKQLGQAVVVDNKPGAGGALAAGTMAGSAKPDGYTLAQAPLAALRLPLMQKTTWDPHKDFTHIIHLTGYILCMAVQTESPFKTWADVVAYAKANPGKLVYGSSGHGGTPHVGTEMIAQHDGIKLTHVPYKGGPDLTAALAGGHVMIMSGSTQMKAMVDAGKFRVLNVWTADRVSIWPEVPTLKELGYPFVFESPYGLVGPKGMDPATVKKLHDAFKIAMDDPASAALLAKFDKVPRYLGSEDYRRYADELIKLEREGLAQVGLLKKD
ncbi:MAG: Bug family tripartite tricarboxylate transporter substrate binding protein [Hyphomicrobiaceae bacterium]